MHKRPVLDYKDVMNAMRAMIAEAKARPGRPVAYAIMDDHGDLVAFACDAGANPAMARPNALKKAYTSACMRMNTEEFGPRLAAMGGSSPIFAAGGGGLVIKQADGVILGGIGVSGRPSGPEDEAIAMAGLEVLRAAKVCV